MKTIGTRTAVVTGASSGIGQSCVTRMVEAGWHVFATVRKAEDRGRLLAANDPRLTPVLLDVEDRATITAAAEQVALQLGKRELDGLVNVAGIGIVRPIEYAREKEIQEIFDINVFGQLAVTQAFLPLLRKSRGRIVNISSVGAHIAIPFGGLLNASKSAFGLLSDTLRLELHPFGISVSAVEPGAIKTPAVDKTLGHMDEVLRGLPAEANEQYGAMLKRFARTAYEREIHGSSPEVVAKAVHHALTARKPRIRYRVGKHSTILTTLPRILPDKLLDILRFRMLGLPTQFGVK